MIKLRAILYYFKIILTKGNIVSKEEWLSGLKHWFAKSKYKLFCTMGSNPFSSKIINLHPFYTGGSREAFS